MNGEGRYMLVVMLIILVYFTGGCGGGGGGPKVIEVVYEPECYVTMSGVCCFEDERVVHNGLDTICQEPDTNVVWDGHALYLEDK